MILAYATYGGFLHSTHARPLAWILSIVFCLGVAGITTIFWTPFRRVILLGFQSDIGYFVMAVLLASLAVVAVTQFEIFAYLTMVVAVSLLVRVDLQIADFKDSVAFLALSLLALLGLGLSWLVILLIPISASLRE
ncbi:MAG: hypothetical protein HC922_02570 [Leptolyngbyaceae cyanobacterium SM2_3_12]|nr:hypothetical protein [Leptolyngbyaceae cyanobacterium SM2_3_12]